MEPEVQGLLERMALRVDVDGQWSPGHGVIEAGFVFGGGEVLDGAEGLADGVRDFFGRRQHGGESGAEFGRGKVRSEEPGVGRVESELTQKFAEEPGVELGKHAGVVEGTGRRRFHRAMLQQAAR